MSTRVESVRVVQYSLQAKLDECDMQEAYWLRMNKPERAAVCARMKDMFARKAEKQTVR